MTSFVPSQIRVVRIYRERAPARTRNMVGPMTRYRWPDKHPLDNKDPWCIDATGWLCDPISQAPWDAIGQVAVPAALDDDALTITGTAISDDGLFAGIYFSGGTPGFTSRIRFVLTGAETGAQKGLDILLRIESVAAVQANPPGFATSHGSIVTIGGVRYSFPGSST